MQSAVCLGRIDELGKILTPEASRASEYMWAVHSSQARSRDIVSMALRLGRRCQDAGEKVA